MQDLIRQWDGESVVVRYDRPSDAWIFIVIHDRTLGMAMGGCRLKVYPTPNDALRDALRLAEGMTLKWAAIDFPFGGGKAVLAPSAPVEGKVREGLLLRFGELVESLGGTYGTGVDLGTTPADMNIIGRTTSRVFGRTPEHGGTGDPGPWTALGVFSGMKAACARAFGTRDLAGRSVLVQGVGGVGGPLARRLHEAGARVLVTDALPDRAARAAAQLGAQVVAPEEAYDTECDVFAPCAIGGVLNRRSIARLCCRIVAGSGNNQLEEAADAERLHERGILYVPDFVINAGGAIAHGALEVLGWARNQVEARVLRIGETVGEILEDAARQGESPLREAERRAQRVLRAAREKRTEPAAAALASR
ncbi:MAG: leucine dehydrogenase [Gemmatimonadetes bacterium]|nr:leucine dehydrogenase [Gemmatimonadota bacterium]